MLAVALAIGSSLVYGVSDFLGGLKSRSMPLVTVLLVSQGSALVLLAVLAIARGEGPPDGEFLVYAAIAGLSEAVGVAALYRGLAVGVMSIVTPIAGTAPAVPVVAAIALGEFPEPLQAAGIALAVVGVAIISFQPAGEDSPSGGLLPSVLFGLLTALGFGGFLVAMDAASEGSVPWALLVARTTSVTAFVIAFLIQWRPLELRRSDVPVLVLIGVLIICADAMYGIASTEGLLSVVAVLSSLYPVVTIALARVYLNERIDRHQQLGVAIALVGVATISASQA
jgi:drug/metabolite transporter (DMT)-like permease